MVEPPLEAGAVKGTDACPFPGVAVPIIGAPGIVPEVAPPIRFVQIVPL